MPWIKKEICTGCGVCIDSCPVDTIYLEDQTAIIDMNGCIRCGICHDACPMDAVRHDSEKTEEDIQSNLDLTEKCMKECILHLGSEKEGQKCLNRMIKHFSRQKKVIEKTLAALRDIKGQP